MNKPLRTLSLIAGFSAVLVSCAVKEPMEQSEMTRQALPENTQIPSAYQEAANAATGDVTSGWLKTFQDPQLESLVEEAIKNNLNLRAAIANVDAAAGMATQAGSELQPVIAAAGKASKYDGGGWKEINTKGAALNLSWEIDLWGRVRSQAKAGQAAFEASQYQLEWIYQSVAAQTAKVWFLLSEAKQQLALTEDALALYEKTLKLVAAKHEQGKITSGDVALARANVAKGKAKVRQAMGAKQQASRALELLLGRYPAAAIEGADQYNIDLDPIPTGLPSELLERRPDLLAAQHAIAAQFFTVETAKAARLPRISLTAAAGTSSNELADILSLGTDFWSVGSNFMAPIFTGGYLKAQVDIESARFQAALANYGQLALKAFSEVEQGLSNETLLREREEYMKQVVRDSEESLRVATRQFKAGKVDLLSVLQQQGILIGAKVNLINIQDQRLQQRVDLYMALGGGFDGVH